jgi:oligoribonuclease
MDLEMTGLDPARHTIVEIATLVTDDDLKIVAEGPDLVVRASTEQLSDMDDYVRGMHARSGLLGAIVSSTISLEEAGRLTLEFLQAQLPSPRSVPLAGSSIGTDRRFLAQQLPAIEDYLHYRSVDVSTIKELCRRWYPEVLAAAPPKRATHRAMDDIKESLDELRYYHRVLFHPEMDTEPRSRSSDPQGQTSGDPSYVDSQGAQEDASVNEAPAPSSQN